MEDIPWFAIEAKVRGIVREIIEPSIKRVQDIKETNEKLLRKEETLQDRMTSMEITMSQTNLRVENLSTFTNKIVESEASMRSFEAKTTSLFDKTFSKFEILSSEILTLSEKFSVLDKQKTLIEENLAGIEKTLLMTKTNFEKSFERLEEDISKQFEGVEGKIKGLDSQVRQINRKIEGISEDLAETDFFARKADRVNGEHSEKLAAMQRVIQGNKKELQESLEKVRSSMFAHQKEAQDASKRIIKYIETDFKVSMNMGFMEHLYSVASDPRTMHRLAIYEKEKLSEWGSSLHGPLKDMIEQSKLRCQSIIETPFQDPSQKVLKNESKESLNHNSALKEKSSPSIDSIQSKDPSESEENDSVPTFPLNSKPFSQDRQLFSSMSMFAEPVYAPQIEVIDYMPFIQDLKKEITDLRSELLAEFLILSQKFEALHLESLKLIHILKDKQETFIDTSNKKSLDIEFLIKEALHECNLVASLRKRDLSDIQASLSELEAKLTQSFQDHSKTTESAEEITKKLSTLFEIAKISIALQMQDEFDRESIALMGQKEVKLKGSLKKPVVAFDKNCMSCSGEKPMVQSLFKLACLAYTPSAVVYSKQEFSRRELIEIQKKMVEELPAEKLEILAAVEEKQKNRARSALIRRNRPGSVPFNVSNASGLEVYSSIASELPIVHRRLI